MNKINFFFLVALLGLLMINSSCNTAEKTAEAAKTEIKTETKKMEEKEAIDYAKFGISESSVASVGALENGSIAPDFMGKDQDGKDVQLTNLTAKGDVVIVFYRGYWCPYCTKHLGEFVEKLDAIKAKGATVIAVAPEGSGNIDKTAESTKLDIPFISDSNNEIMKKYGVAFKVNDAYNKRFSDWKEGMTLGEVNGQEEAYLPIPATYIIGKDGKIKWSHFDPDYSKRSSVDDILKQL